ncbi:PhzF family phenazine biosynthesis protein [Flavobacterium adhaerens]|uniref:PhzF family phenazine biosynthesis protein n=1 Tax=Flavobacterium adhaerens TaxID=3149043 RepID=UPI0032B4F08C
MKLPFYIVDVFAEKKYAGNQLAVFLEATKLSSEQMQQIACEMNFAESTFVTSIQPKSNSASIRIFTVEKEMQFAGHPVLGTSWVLMNKIIESRPHDFKLMVPVGPIPIKQSGDVVWLQAAQPQFWDVFSKDDFSTFSNLISNDIDSQLPIQEVTTGSAFVIVPLQNIQALERLQLDLNATDKWLKDNCKTKHRALYFYCYENGELHSRMFCVEKNQLFEDAATGSASTCLQAFLLKYHSPNIKTVNHQGDFINRPSRIYFDGELSGDNFDIKIGGKVQFVAKGEWEV